MNLQSNNQNQSQPSITLSKQKGGRRFSDPKEHERLLKTHAGIFKHNIPEFAKRLAKRARPQINYSR